MQDLKHINHKKRFWRFRFSHRRKNQSVNAYKRLIEPKRATNRLKLVLPLLALMLGAYPVFNLLASARTAASGVNKTSPQATAPVKPFKELNEWQSFQVAAEALQAARFDGNRYNAPLADGGRIVYGIDSELQQRVLKVMEDFRVPYGV